MNISGGCEAKLECAEDTYSSDGLTATSSHARILTEAETEKLLKDTKLVSDFKQNKLEKEAQKNWDLFYKRNTTKFFKDRHWTRREFSDLINNKTGEKLVIFEVGCGVGNFLFPLLEEEGQIYFYACDFSPRAVEFVKGNEKYDPKRCEVFQCDITKDNLTDRITSPDVDVATLIFVLSAIHPDKMVHAVRNIYQVVKPGGCVLIRDYGLYDHAMLRFAPGHKLSENFYVRQDGTRAFYFTLGGPLFSGDIENYNGRCHVMCPWHSYMFDLETGKNEIGLQQKVYEMKYDNGYVYIDYHTELATEPIDRQAAPPERKITMETRKTSVLEAPFQLSAN